MNQYLIGAFVVITVLIGVEQYGEHRIQVQWDKDKAVREALLNNEKRTNKETIDALNTQHEKDIKSATSKAGRDAVSNWIKSHGLLPNGDRVSSRGDGKAESPKVSDGESLKSEPSNRLEEFAIGCAKDALKVMDWQEWAKRENLEIE